MKKPNQMVQMDILGPFYLENSDKKNYFISCEDDCSRKTSSEWSEMVCCLNHLNNNFNSNNIYSHFMVIV
jgi:hypothetical protein